jgi:hypothetical protein
MKKNEALDVVLCETRAHLALLMESEESWRNSATNAAPITMSNLRTRITRYQSALRDLEGAVVLDAETWREAREIIGSLDVPTHKPECVYDNNGNCVECRCVRARLRNFLAAHPLEDKP